MASVKIQSLLDGQDVHLTNLEISNFFADISKKEFSTILEFAMERGAIDPSRALHESIKRFDSPMSIYIMALAYRMKADSNSYSDDGMHVLTSLYHYSGKVTPKVNMATILSIYFGSNPVNPSHKNRKTSVLQWVDSKHSNHNLEALFPAYANEIDQKTALILGILTDSTENLNCTVMEANDVKTAIMAGSNQVLSYAPHIDQMTGMDLSTLFWSVEYHNVGAFSYYTDMGHKISYPLMNTMISRLEVYNSKKDYLLYDNYLTMIELSISKGQNLDTYQQSLLSNSSPGAYQMLMEKYQTPYWEKECGYNGGRHASIPERLRKLAVILDLEIDNDQRGVCASLRRIANMDLEVLVEAARLRQSDRLRSRHSTLEEYAHSSPDGMKYFNDSPVDGDYNLYLDLYSTSYRDTGGRVWGFLSRDYNKILEGKRNPINGSPVPESFLLETERKMKRLENIGMDLQKPIKFSDAINELFNPDAISNDQSEEELKELMSHLTGVHVSRQDINLLTSEQLEESLKNSGYSVVISYLKKDHALVTAAYIINYHMKFRRETGVKMLNSIRRFVHTDSRDAYHVPMHLTNVGRAQRKRRDRSQDVQ